MRNEMINKIKTATIIGIKGNYVEVEVVISNGIPSFTIVGLVDATVKEAKERVRGAIINSGFRYPNRRIIMNLSPADIRKNGTHFDLPLAISLLRSSQQVSGYQNLIDEYAFIGELSLSGEVKPVTGVLPMVMSLYEEGIKKVFVPWGNRMEASLVKGIQVFAAKNLSEIVNHLEQKKKIEPIKNEYNFDRKIDFELDYDQVRGQEAAKRAISIAAAGSHGLLMVGSPSSGKTMLSKRIPSILPPMEYKDIIESTNIYSILGKLSEREPYIAKRPFRNPHYSISRAGLIGGGSYPKPGEVSLANKGVLFIDELAELKRDAIEALRVPLEEKKVNIVRNGVTVTFPADFLFIAGSNLCPCGYYSDPYHPCKCTPKEVANYMKKISGPIMERIDLHIKLNTLKYEEFKSSKGRSSSEMREEIFRAREIQKERYKYHDVNVNADLDEKLIDKFCAIDSEGEKLLKMAFEKNIITPRTYSKTLKISRTIADMEGSFAIKQEHVAEALQYRSNLSEYN